MRFSSQGFRWGSVSLREVVTMDASLRLGCSVRGKDTQREMTHLATESTQKLPRIVNSVSGSFVQFLRNHHILIRSDNTTVVAYVNRQGSTHSPQLHSLAQKRIMWGRKHFHSLRATHVPGMMNVGAELLSWGNPLFGVYPASSGSEPIAGEVRPSCRRSLRLARKHSLPSILLSVER